MRAFFRVGAAALSLVASAPVGMADAQSYDGHHVVKFGVFHQSTLFHVHDSIVGGTSGSGSAGSAATGGLSAGIDFHLPWRWLVGVEIDASLGDARTHVNSTNYGFDYLANLRGRLGHFVRPDLMLYGTAGLSYLGWESQQQGVSRFKVAETVPGAIVGLGAEWEWYHVLLFAEYNHGWYDSRPYTLGATERRVVDSEVDVFRVGLKFKVGHDHGWGRWYDPRPLK